ncbi:MAG: CNP1-like family protein [Salinibacterium sp.]|nr:CNP1-like family protein [Salinibacterium sp.]
MPSFPARLIIAVFLPLAIVAGCGEVEVKPQEPGALIRGLPRDDGGSGDWEEVLDGTLPENQYVNLPESSAPATWFKFKPERVIKHETALDSASISVGGDGITRYTLLIRSASGVDNVSYEGIRCATQEWKMYATGRPDGSWSRVPNPRWHRITQTGLNAIRYTLFNEYACDRDGVTPANGAAVIARIRKSNDGMLSTRQP